MIVLRGFGRGLVSGSLVVAGLGFYVKTHGVDFGPAPVVVTVSTLVLAPVLTQPATPLLARRSSATVEEEGQIVSVNQATDILRAYAPHRVLTVDQASSNVAVLRNTLAITAARLHVEPLIVVKVTEVQNVQDNTPD